MGYDVFFFYSTYRKTDYYIPSFPSDTSNVPVVTVLQVTLADGLL